MCGRTKLAQIRVPQPVLWLAAAASEAVGRALDRPRYLNLDKHREMTAGSWICDSDKLHALGFEAAPLKQRLAQTVAWYRQAGWLT